MYIIVTPHQLMSVAGLSRVYTVCVIEGQNLSKAVELSSKIRKTQTLQVRSELCFTVFC